LPFTGGGIARLATVTGVGEEERSLMYFPAEHLLDKLQISAQELSDFEQKGIVKGLAREGRFFYSSRDLYRLKGILLFITRGLTLEEAQRRVDHPVQERSAAKSRR
jgi:DNA-binding transcriptional MerR regulator